MSPERSDTHGAARYTRRAFVTAAGKTAAGLVLGGAVVAGCGSDADTTTSATDTDPAIIPTSSGPTTLRVAVPIDPISLDPVRWVSGRVQQFTRLTNEPLLRWTDDRRILPHLSAILPQVSKNRKTYTIKLRNGVAFHHGKKLEAADVVHSYESVRAPGGQSQWFTRLDGILDTVEAVDPVTVKFSLQKPFTPFLSTLALIPIVASDLGYSEGETYEETVIGTGPFVFAEWIPGSTLTMIRNGSYWGGPVTPERLEFRFIPDEAARTADLVAGAVDIVPAPASDQLDPLRAAGMDVRVPPNSTTLAFMFANPKEDRPTSTYAFRRAIAESIDRGGIVREVFRGTAVPASTYLANGTLHFDAELGGTFGPSPRPDQIRTWLEKAKLDPSQPLDRALQVITLDDRVSAQISTIIQTALAAAGFTAAMEALPTAAWAQRLFDGQYDLALALVPTQPGYGFGPDYVYDHLHSGRAGNFSSVKDKQLDKLLDQAVAAPDGEQYGVAWRKVQQYDLESGLWRIPLVTARYAEAVNPDVISYSSSPTGYLRHARLARPPIR